MKKVLLTVAVLMAFATIAEATGRQRFVVRQQVVRQRVVQPVVRRQVIRQRIVQPVVRQQVVQQFVVPQQVYVPAQVQQFVVPQAYSVQRFVAPQKVQVQQFNAAPANKGCAAMLGY